MSDSKRPMRMGMQKSQSTADGKPKQSEDVKATKILLSRGSSHVNVIDHAGKAYHGLNVWSDLAPAVQADPDLLFAKCVILPKSNKDKLLAKQVDPWDRNETVFELTQRNAWNYNQSLDPLSVNDIGALPHTNVPCVLAFCRERYLSDQIYTTADPLLLAINPFMDLGNTTTEWILKYRDSPDHTKLPPHVFSIARTALDNLHSVHKNQSIIVSGESGAGKTEATKQVMRYFAAAQSGNTDVRIQTAVLAANPVLEAFGNAKTMRNNNSSRFGRFMQLQVAKSGGIEFGAVQNFLLEKSRIITQDAADRSYHIFYQLLKGSSPEMKKRLHLLPAQDYRLLTRDAADVEVIDDVKDFEEVVDSLTSMGMSVEERDSVFSIVSGVLLLGNVDVIATEKAGVEDAADITGAADDLLTTACSLLFLDRELVKKELLVKTTYAAGHTITGVWRRHEAQMLKESLSKAMYDNLFSWIVRKLNVNIQPPKGFKHFMGMLDIFGFEVFKNNSLEQLFINITNERLQKNFIDIVFERETRLYREEGISSETLVWTDNDAILDALCAKKASLLATLEDQCLAPSGSDEKLVANMYSQMKGQSHIQQGRISPNINFVVVHTIGEIQYCGDNFLFKNKDVLRAELAEVVMSSKNCVSSNLFEGVVLERGKLAKGQLIGSQFMLQLERLMEIINGTEPHFIRCVKPNESKKPHDWVQAKVLIQLHALSILEALQLKNLGFSYRRPFEEFMYQFKYVDMGVCGNKSLDAKEKCIKLLDRCGISKGDYQIGKTMVFMKNTAPKEMMHKQREVMHAWMPVVNVLEAIMTRNSLRKEMKAREWKMDRLQWHCRKHLAVEEMRKATPAVTRANQGQQSFWASWGA
eukprot:GHVQ01009377.1.p1 GENE.GHVQ01009377.1~~GHVQ01009377.1.p1  ORF type:complete len:867 (+),score=136.57 GHVQ01009377.1:255-2855(+)